MSGSQSKAAVLGTVAVVVTILAGVTDLIPKARSLYRDYFGDETATASAPAPSVVDADALGRQAELYGRRKHNWLMAVKDSLEQNPPEYHTFSVTNECGSDVAIALHYKLPGPRPRITEGWFPVEVGLATPLRAFVSGRDAAIYVSPISPQFRWIPNSERTLGEFAIPPGAFADDGTEIIEGTGTERLTFEHLILSENLSDSITYEIHCEQP